MPTPEDKMRLSVLAYTYNKAWIEETLDSSQLNLRDSFLDV